MAAASDGPAWMDIVADSYANGAIAIFSVGLLVGLLVAWGTRPTSRMSRRRAASQRVRSEGDVDAAELIARTAASIEIPGCSSRYRRTSAGFTSALAGRSVGLLDPQRVVAIHSVVAPAQPARNGLRYRHPYAVAAIPMTTPGMRTHFFIDRRLPRRARICNTSGQ